MTWLNQSINRDSFILSHSLSPFHNNTHSFIMSWLNVRVWEWWESFKFWTNTDRWSVTITANCIFLTTIAHISRVCLTEESYGQAKKIISFSGQFPKMLMRQWGTFSFVGNNQCWFKCSLYRKQPCMPST